MELQRLQSDIMAQVDKFQSILTDRLTSAMTSDDLEPTSVLGSLGVIHEVNFHKILSHNMYSVVVSSSCNSLHV